MKNVFLLVVFCAWACGAEEASRQLPYWAHLLLVDNTSIAKRMALADGTATTASTRVVGIQTSIRTNMLNERGPSQWLTGQILSAPKEERCGLFNQLVKFDDMDIVESVCPMGIVSYREHFYWIWYRGHSDRFSIRAYHESTVPAGVSGNLRPSDSGGIEIRFPWGRGVRSKS